MYNTLFYQINELGETNSHEFLIKTSSEYIKFDDNMHGIWIPANKMLNRTKYEWFTRMNPDQIFQGNFILSKYIILALAPNTDINAPTDKPDWFDFWRIPA